MVNAEGEIELGDFKTWCAVGVVVAWVALQYTVLAMCCKVAQRLTFDVLEQQHDIGAVKDTVRNIWTNIALIGALLLTIAAPLIMDGAMAERFETHPAWTSAFCGLASTSALMFTCMTIECVLHLIYTEALTSPGTMRYLIQNHGAIGGPMLHCIMGGSHLTGSIFIWVLLMYGLPCAVCFALGLVFGCAILIFVVFVPASIFSPDKGDSLGSIGWLWAEKGDRPPKLFGGGFLTEAHIKTMHDRAKAALLHEDAQARQSAGRELELRAAEPPPCGKRKRPAGEDL